MPEAADAPARPGKAPRRPEDITVLIVDDEVDVANYFASVLAEADINVVTANDGDEAIEVLQKIAKKKSDVFDKKYGPNMKDPEQIIKRFKKTYGQQSSSIIQRKYFQQKR